MKTCTKCGKTKKLSLFTKDNKNKDKHSTRCKECKNNQNTGYRNLIALVPVDIVVDENSDTSFENPPCLGLTELFYNYSDKKALVAEKVCKECRYQKACLDGAITRGEFNGVWGGFNFSNQRSRAKFVKELKCIDQMMNG